MGRDWSRTLGILMRPDEAEVTEQRTVPWTSRQFQKVCGRYPGRPGAAVGHLSLHYPTFGRGVPWSLALRARGTPVRICLYGKGQ